MNLHYQLFLVSLSLILASHADSVIVAGVNATESGDGSWAPGFSSPEAFQTVYGSRNFSGPVLIRGIGFRMDEASGSFSLRVDIPRLTLQFSTYSGTFAMFSRSSYLANAGADSATVFDGPITWASTDLAGGGPNPFDFSVQFSTPFTYDPATGPLLMGYTPSGPFSSSIRADYNGTTDTTFGWSSTAIGLSFGFPVAQFNVIPIPEAPPGLLLFVGVSLLRLLKRRL